MPHDRFTRGRSTFPCVCCGRVTRESGQPVDSRLCFECWELAGLQNSVFDGEPPTSAWVVSSRDELVKAAVKKGSPEAKLRAQFSALWG